MPTDSMVRLEERLFQHGVLVDLNVGYWSARSGNSSEDLGLKPGVPLPDHVIGLGTKRLIPAEYTGEWTNLAGRGRAVLKKSSFDFPMCAAAFVPTPAFPSVEEKLTAIMIEFDASKDAFLRDFDTIKEEFLNSLKPSHRERIAAEIPAKDVIASKFYFRWAVFAITLPKKLRLTLHDAKAREAQEAAQRRYEADLEIKVSEFVETSVIALRRRVAETFTALAERIKTGSVVTERSLNIVRRTVDDFKALNFFGDDQIDRHLAEFKTRYLDVDPDALTAAMNTAMQQQCAQIASAALTATDINAVTGRYNRRIMLEPKEPVTQSNP